VVIVFAVIKEAEKLLLAAENSSITRDQFLWIASDGWTSQLPVEKNDYSYVRQLRSKFVGVDARILKIKNCLPLQGYICWHAAVICLKHKLN